ncbi:tRNA (N(6)-L-threonylcarbamoyladenosine(37)-C(2))-methylthiotransferase [Candidatus Woesearchaeota archaeon]|nr:tRNA (N(6)-L-threonylcarbamoyladenosine(37)-C(2))-methylthiotransferase [Candidatus Woesearchaeota archaeon]
MSTNICIKTFGCSANFAEAEMMKGLLAEADFKIVGSVEDAFIVILNICTVKGDDNALKEIRKVHEEHPYKKIIVAGCIPKHLHPQIREILPDVSLVSTHNVNKVVSVVEETLHDNPVAILAKNKTLKINLPRIRKNPVIGIIPIASGCRGRCAYCSVKLIKGDLISYPVESIINEVRQCVKDRCKEIWITAQDTGCYGVDIGTNIAELLKKIVEIPGEFKIRLGMANPKYVLLNLEELIKVFKHPKMFKFLHIPVQSGNDKVLKSMKRPYQIEDYKHIIKRFREEIPDITISTDIICGFPGETYEQFKDSLLLIDQTKPDVLNISRFVARPGTRAEKREKQLPGGEIKDRSRKLSSQFEWTAFSNNRKWKNWEGEIIIDEHGKNGTFIGRNHAYKPVIVSGNFVLGQKVKVRIIDVTKFDLRAQPI